MKSQVSQHFGECCLVMGGGVTEPGLQCHPPRWVGANEVFGVRRGGHDGWACGVLVPGVRVGTTEWERPARLKLAA